MTIKRNHRRYLLMLIIAIVPMLICSCWNYREIELLGIVLGAAVDKAADGKYVVTAELVRPAGGPSQVDFEVETVSAEGDTMFDAVRGLIPLSGRRMYWSHAKIMIVSEEIARGDMLPVLDWVYRDAETREDIRLLVSKEKTAGEVLKGNVALTPSVSLHMEQTLRAQKSLARYPNIPLYKYIKDMSSKSIEPILPSVSLENISGKKVPKILGTAIFKHNKLIGYFDITDSKSLLWLRDELKGGLYIVKNVAGTETNVTLEIFKSKTKVKPVVQGNKLRMKVDVKVNVGIAEISSTTDFISKKGREVLKAEAERQIKNDLQIAIKKAQEQYNSDIFGFGSIIKINKPKVWKGIEKNWDEVFPELDTQINVNVEIKGSATNQKPIQEGLD